MRIKIYTQKVYAAIIGYMLSFSALLNNVNGLLNTIGLHTVADTIILYGALFCLILMGLILMLVRSERFEADVFALVLFFVGYYLFSALAFPENRAFLFTSWADYAQNPVYVLFVYSLPGYIFARKLEDYDYFCFIMRFFSYAVVSMSILVFFFAKESSASQYMTFSYNMLTHLMFLMFNTPGKLRFVHYGIVGLGVIAFVLGGARGALLSLIIAVAWFYVTTNKSEKKLLIGFLIITLGLFIVILKSEIISCISMILDKLSINSRSIQYLFNGNFWDDSERMPIFEAGKKAIGLIGKGFMADRAVIGVYPHNLFLELLIQHGALLGSVFVVMLLIIIGRAMSAKNTSEYVWIIMLLPCGFLKLMLTGSYINQEPAFYILLGLCVNSVIRRETYAHTDDQHRVRGRKHWQNC